MKTIICYGDSNTFGYNPANSKKFDDGIYWTSVLQAKLGNDYKIINEGVCDRMGFVDNPKGFEYSARLHFPKFIEEVSNFDIFILWLGTNDLQFQNNISLEVIENGLRNLINLSKVKAKSIILIPPVLLDERVLTGTFNFQFNKTSIIRSKEAQSIYEQIARDENLIYFDLNKFVKPCDIDGLHYDKNGHKIIGECLADCINKIDM